MTQKLVSLKKKITDHNHDKCQVSTEKLAQKKKKHLLIESELKKLKTFDSSNFVGKSDFEEDGTQKYLVFQPMYSLFKRVVVNSDHILLRKSKGLSDENNAPPSAPHNFLNPSLNYSGSKTRVRFSGKCLKQDKTTYTHKKIVKIYIVYEINKNENTRSSYPTLENCLFGAVSLTKNSNIDKYKYSGYGIGFNIDGTFSFSGTGLGINFWSRYEFINED